MNTKLRAEAARGLLLWQGHFQMKSSMMTTNIASRIFRLSVTKKLIQRIRLLVLKVKRDLYGLCNPVMKFNYGIGVIINGETEVSRMDEALSGKISIWEMKPMDYAVFKCIGTGGDCISETWSNSSKNCSANRLNSNG